MNDYKEMMIEYNKIMDAFIKKKNDYNNSK